MTDYDKLAEGRRASFPFGGALCYDCQVKILNGQVYFTRPIEDISDALAGLTGIVCWDCVFAPKSTAS